MLLYSSARRVPSPCQRETCEALQTLINAPSLGPLSHFTNGNSDEKGRNEGFRPAVVSQLRNWDGNPVVPNEPAKVCRSIEHPY